MLGGFGIEVLDDGEEGDGEDEVGEVEGNGKGEGGFVDGEHVSLELPESVGGVFVDATVDAFVI